MKLFESLKNKKFLLFNIFFTLYIAINLIGGERGLISYFDKKNTYVELIEKDKKLIKITREPFVSMSNNRKKNLKAIQTTQVVLIKQMLLEMSSFFCKKLNLIGVGFRVSVLKVLDISLLHFKLGYSHSIYFKIPKNLKIFCLKANKLFIVGNSYQFVTQTAALIRSCKVPEPYKGKGILYATEKITLKEGKKV